MPWRCQNNYCETRSQIFVLDEAQTLQLRDVQVKWEASNEILVQANFQTGDLVLTSPVFGVLPGTKVKGLPQKRGTPEISSKHISPVEE